MVPETKAAAVHKKKCQINELQKPQKVFCFNLLIHQAVHTDAKLQLTSVGVLSLERTQLFFYLD